MLFVYLILFCSIAFFGSSSPVGQLYTTIGAIACVIVMWYRGQQIRIPTVFSWLFGLYIVSQALLLIPFPLRLHPIFTPEYATFRLPILEYFGFSRYPLAFVPAQHLLSLLFSISMVALHYTCVAELQQNSLQENTRLLRYPLVIAFLFCWIGWTQVWTDSPYIYWISHIPLVQKEAFFGTFINPNHSGYFLASVLPLALIQTRSGWKYVGSALLIASIIQTQSRGAIGCMMVVLCWYNLQNSIAFKKLVIASLVSVIVGLFLLYFYADIHSFTAERTIIWQDSLRIFDMSWWLGTGYGGFSRVYPMVKSTPQYTYTAHAHEEYLQYLIEQGMIGSSVFCAIGWMIYHKYLRNTTNKVQTAILQSVCCFAIAGFVDFPLRLSSLGMLLATTTAFWHSKEKTTNIPSLRIHPSVLVVFCAVLGFQIVTWNSPNSQYNHIHPNYNDTIENLEPALYADPLHVNYLQNYIHKQEKLDSKEKNLLSSLLAIDKTNVQSWILQARISKRLGDHSNSCLAWNRVWELDFPILSDKLNFVAEALACTPTLWEAIFALPDNSAILVRASQLLFAQNLNQEALFCLERASVLDDMGKQQYISALIDQKQYKQAVQLFDFTQLHDCISYKNASKLGFVFHIRETPSFYDGEIEHCPPSTFREYRKMLAGLYNGEKWAITQAQEQRMQQREKKRALEEDPIFLTALVQAYILQQEQIEACSIIFSYQHTYPKYFTKDHAQECTQKQLPSSFVLLSTPSYTEFQPSSTQQDY